jgi:soluble lytic murein transglycosylase-like protein
MAEPFRLGRKVKNMRKYALVALGFLTSASLASSDALAKKRQNPALSDIAQVCPLDEAIRVGSGQAISRYSTLAACAGKIIIAPAINVEPRPTIRIVPQFEEVDQPIDSGVTETLNRPALNIVDAAGHDNASRILSLRPATYTTPFDRTIQDVAQRHRVDPLLLHAVIKQESGYRQSVRSHAGALGLMQIMPATGASLGVATPDLVVPESNVDAGARLLKKLYYKYGGNFQLVLAAYNAGEGAVQKYGNRIPPYTETQNYVKRVLAHYDRLVTDAAGPGAGR